uniref:Uncharacterized protein n=1 Tax=Arundo donax TaxID=35708 RepID=A0A0A9E1F3_ARUDO
MHGTVSASATHLVRATAAGSAPSAFPSTLSKSTKSTTSRPYHGRRRRTLWCRATGGRSDEGLLWLPRRDLLAGLTGVAAGLSAYPDLSAAAPQVVLEESCRRGEKVSDKFLECTDRGLPCPPSVQGFKIVDFSPASEVKRVRRPVHLLDPEYAGKYQAALAAMKALPASNPLSFTEQAAIHEALL